MPGPSEKTAPLWRAYDIERYRGSGTLTRFLSGFCDRFHNREYI